MEQEQLTREIDLGLAKIMCLAMLINRKTELCCFVNDSGHVRSMDIKLYPTVKNYNGTPVSFEVKYDASGDPYWYVDSDERLQEINRCIEFLETCLKDRSINYDMLNKVKEYVITAYEI